MTYADSLDYLFSQLPMYQRQGKAAYRANLDNTLAFLKIIGNPEKDFLSIHVAGTNGKGSVSHMLASVFQEAGYKTALFTSPHLKDFRERIKINGKKIAKKSVVRFIEKHKKTTADIEPSFFEWTAALAFDCFKKEKVDIAIIETGMGGRLDSTNVIKPILSVITNIGFDHTQFLGNTLPLIAIEKAGIIKLNTPVVIGESVEETKGVFLDKALLMRSQITFAEEKPLPPFQCDLRGPYQQSNQQTVLHALSILKVSFTKIDDKSMKNGFKNVVKNTGLHGRWEYISKKPKTLVDVAHNKEGIALVLEAIQRLDFDTLHIVWGMVNDKDVKALLKILPVTAHYYFCQPNIPRGLAVKELMDVAHGINLMGSGHKSVKKALKKAQSSAGKNDLIYVGGSTFVVAEVL